jgi:phosphatidate cytidylyltransferase
MKIRIISSLIALPLLFGVMFLGGNVLLVACALLSIVGIFEFYNAFSRIKVYPIYIVGYIATISYYLNIATIKSGVITSAIVFMTVLSLLVANVFAKKRDIFDMLVTLGGIFYITFFFSHVYLLSQIDTTRFFIWFIFILAWVSDTFAYFTGYFFGRTKLIPDVSPKKTVEGSLGGILGTVLVCVAYSMAFDKSFIYYSMLLALIGSPLSQIGDLIASKIKRHTGIKDFGNIMPGHGGVLDRFDSILITAPVVYYFVVVYAYIFK